MTTDPTTGAVEALRDLEETLPLDLSEAALGRLRNLRQALASLDQGANPAPSADLREILSNSLALLRIKYGNTDPAASELMGQIAASLDQGDGEELDPASLPRCDKLDGSTLRIVPSYTEAGMCCEANCLKITDGERTAIYVPYRVIEMDQGDGHASEGAVAAVAAYLRTRDEALGPTGPEHTDEERKESASDIIKLCAPIAAPGVWAEEQIERVARAIFARVRHLDPKISLDDAGDYYDRMDEMLKPFWREQSKDALSTLNAAPGASEPAGEAVRAKRLEGALWYIANYAKDADIAAYASEALTAILRGEPTPPAQGHVEPSREADAYLRALLDYSGGFYGAAIKHGMRAGPAADAVQHIERAARQLHALAIQPPGGAVGAGWKLVQRKPTEEMVTAGVSAISWSKNDRVQVRDIVLAAWDAAPAQPSDQPEAAVVGREEAVKLWMLLDDIDTASDAAKGDDAAFRKFVDRHHRRRFDIMSGKAFDQASALLAPSTVKGV